jgi:hypothetical protein
VLLACKITGPKYTLKEKDKKEKKIKLLPNLCNYMHFNDFIYEELVDYMSNSQPKVPRKKGQAQSVALGQRRDFNA